MTDTTDSPDTISIFLVDDQPLVRAGLRMFLDTQPDLVVVGEADSGEAAVRALTRTVADVVLMDVRMPGLDGIEATRQLLSQERPVPGQARPPLRVIVLTTFDLDQYAHDALRAGASGFLLKNAPPEQLIDAVRTVHRGDAVIAPSTTRRLLEHFRPPPAAAPDLEQQRLVASLTSREREILLLIARGMSNAEMATALFISPTTVKTHVSNLLAKLGARDRVQAVIIAYQSRLIDTSH